MRTIEVMTKKTGIVKSYTLSKGEHVKSFLNWLVGQYKPHFPSGFIFSQETIDSMFEVIKIF